MTTSVLKQSRIWLHGKLIRYGIDIRKRRMDRKVLEEIIFPEILAKPEYARILFVGCAWYTSHYARKFEDRQFVTMEISPEESKYGAPLHIVDGCENIDQHFAAQSLDVVILNGVYGFGLNEWHGIEKTFRGIYRALTPGGLFILGWNDLPGHAPFSIEKLEQIVPFAPFEFPTLHTSVYESDSKNRHRFHFYAKDAI